MKRTRARDELMKPRGAYVMGRNMFGPVRGPWDVNWRGWWGDEPPYHAPVFVLTHYPHDPIAMEGGTTFHFITEGFDVAFERAAAAAGDLGVDIAGGASTVRRTFATASAADSLASRQKQIRQVTDPTDLFLANSRASRCPRNESRTL